MSSSPLSDFRPLPYPALRFASVAATSLALVVPVGVGRATLIGAAAGVLVTVVLALRPAKVVGAVLGVVAAGLGVWLTVLAGRALDAVALKGALLIAFAPTLDVGGAAPSDLASLDDDLARVATRGAILTAVGGAAFASGDTVVDAALTATAAACAVAMLALGVSLRIRNRRRVRFLFEVAMTPGRFEIEAAAEAPPGLPTVGKGSSVLVLYDAGEPGYRNPAVRTPVAVVRT